MKKILINLIILLPLALYSQVRDDFSDGNFTTNPEWTGDTSAFTVNTQNQLQLNSSGSDTSFLTTQGLNSPSREWSFWLKMSFNTSLNNYARIYLGSDSRDLKGNVNAVYIQAGGSGDSLTLFRQSGNIHLPIFKFPFLRTNKTVNVFRIRICRDSAGNWDLYADSTGGKGSSGMAASLTRDEFPVSGLGFIAGIHRAIPANSGLTTFMPGRHFMIPSRPV